MENQLYRIQFHEWLQIGQMGRIEFILWADILYWELDFEGSVNPDFLALSQDFHGHARGSHGHLWLRMETILWDTCIGPI